MTEPQKKPHAVVFTIGHSTRPISEFIEILKTYGIEKVVDVRTIPRSRHNPQFNKETIEESLMEAGIGYSHMNGLGGLRHALKNSPNAGWRNASFRGFADYMQTEEFRKNIESLIKTAARRPTAVLCAEAVPWRCHRSLIGDALLVRGIEVRHLISATSSIEHKLTPWAKVTDGEITYPPDDDGSGKISALKD